MSGLEMDGGGGVRNHCLNLHITVLFKREITGYFFKIEWKRKVAT